MTPCFRGEITPEVEEKVSKVFDEAVKRFDSVEKLQDEEETPEETGLSVVENIGSYEVTKTIFGKEKVRKVK